MKKSYLAAACAALFAVPAANAVTVLEYQTAASTSNATLTPSIADSSITADLMTAGSGLTANNGSTWNWKGWDTASTSFDAAVGANDYWTWGFDVTDNVSIDLTSMDIRLDRSGTGPDDFEIQASVNGGSAVSLLTHDYGDSDAGVDFTGVDLTGIGLLGPGDSLVFTLAAFNSEGTSGTFDLETVDFNGSDPRSLRIEGTVSAVPLPGAIWLFGSALAGGLAMARRKQRRA